VTRAWWLVAISGAAYFLSTGLGEVWQLAWIAPVPVLLFAFENSAGKAALAGCIAFLLGELNLWTYLTAVIPPVLTAILLLLPASVFALAAVAGRWAVKRLRPWMAAFVFPLVWTGYEVLTAQVSPHGTALSLGYTQTDFLPVLQIASLAGVHGITFVLCLVPSGLAVAWHKQSYAPLIPVAVISVLVLGYGAVRLNAASSGPRVKVGLAVTDEGVGRAFATEDAELARQVVRGYADRVHRLAAQGAQVVVLPEKMVGVTPAYRAEVENMLSEAARQSAVTLVAGLNLAGSSPWRNVAVAFGPDGRKLVEYDKRHMLPGPESGYQVGDTPGLFLPWGVEICKDMDFQPWSREYARRGVKLLAVPAWDFVRDGRFHSRMAVVRGVENGFAIARTAQQGLLTLSDSRGRILAEASSGKAAEVLLVGELAP